MLYHIAVRWHVGHLYAISLEPLSMKKPIYDWKRFWCPPTGRQYLEYGGYLVDPDVRWRVAVNPDVVPFEDIADTPCLILLGEPGIGKSATIHELYSEQKASGAGFVSKSPYDGSRVVAFEFAQFTESSDLRAQVFGHPDLQSWQSGDGRLTLVLDGFDECPVGPGPLVALLAPALEGLPRDRLLLRVVCHTAEWPNPFEDRLRALWGDKAVAAYELAPLRRVDVDVAARAHGIDATAFRAAVERAEAVPLATKPITLNFLLGLYGEGQQLPSTQVELYERGCRMLCAEPPDSLRPSPSSALSPDERVQVAARIAAISTLGRRAAIWTGPDDGVEREHVVPIRKFASLSFGERLGGEAAVRETVKTGLFTSRGPFLFGWAHQTYAEYLAARFVADAGLTLSQIKDLLVHPGDSGGKLMPQLHGTAAWLASLRADVFNEVLARDPDVLLRGDLSSASSDQRAKLINALLELYGAYLAADNDPAKYARYSKLAHPDLAEQLRSHILDRETVVVERRVAIDIAEACNVRTLVPDLLSVALDASEDYHIRAQAVAAVGAIGAGEAKMQLKPLVLDLTREDTQDELKGYALDALWPSQLTAGELFAALTPQRNTSFFGAYWIFLRKLTVDLPDKLAYGDIPAALKWATTYASATQHHDFGRLVDTILQRAWGILDAAGVADGFARVALARLHDNSPIVRDVAEPGDGEGAGAGETKKSLAVDLSADPQKRRKLLDAMIGVLATPECKVAPYELLYTAPPNRSTHPRPRRPLLAPRAIRRGG